MAVQNGSRQASVLVGMEKSGPLHKPEGESLTWRDPQAVHTGNNSVRSALQETCGARWKKCGSCTFFFAFSTESNFRRLWGVGFFFFL